MSSLVRTLHSTQSMNRRSGTAKCLTIVRTRWVDYKKHDFDPYVGPSTASPPPSSPGSFDALEDTTKLRPRLLTNSRPHSAQIEPFWHAWISYAVDTPPTVDPLAKVARSWAKPHHTPNLTASRAAYKPYNTYVHGSPARFCQYEADSFPVLSRKSMLGSLLLSSDESLRVAVLREEAWFVHMTIDGQQEEFFRKLQDACLQVINLRHFRLSLAFLDRYQVPGAITTNDSMNGPKVLMSRLEGDILYAIKYAKIISTGCQR